MTLQLGACIGEGGFGAVFVGKWHGQRCAVKQFFLRGQDQLIENEIEILKNLRHRHIIQFFATERYNGTLVMITDFAEGGSLQSAIEAKTRLDWAMKDEIAKEIAKGLAYIHANHILHRDLKSGNVLLTKHLEVKLCDFGLARVKVTTASKAYGQKVEGTFRWMAPELLTLRPVYSTKSDVYALGMVMWEMAADCTVPFQGQNSNEIIASYIKQGERELIPESTPTEFRNWIESCWQQEPSKRPEASEIYEDDIHTIQGKPEGNTVSAVSITMDSFGGKLVQPSSDGSGGVDKTDQLSGNFDRMSLSSSSVIPLASASTKTLSYYASASSSSPTGTAPGLHIQPAIPTSSGPHERPTSNIASTSTPLSTVSQGYQPPNIPPPLPKRHNQTTVAGLEASPLHASPVTMSQSYHHTMTGFNGPPNTANTSGTYPPPLPTTTSNTGVPPNAGNTSVVYPPYYANMPVAHAPPSPVKFSDVYPPERPSTASAGYYAPQNYQTPTTTALPSPVSSPPSSTTTGAWNTSPAAAPQAVSQGIPFVQGNNMTSPYLSQLQHQINTMALTGTMPSYESYPATLPQQPSYYVPSPGMNQYYSTSRVYHPQEYQSPPLPNRPPHHLSQQLPSYIPSQLPLHQSQPQHPAQHHQQQQPQPPLQQQQHTPPTQQQQHAPPPLPSPPQLQQQQQPPPLQQQQPPPKSSKIPPPPPRALTADQIEKAAVQFEMDIYSGKLLSVHFMLPAEKQRLVDQHRKALEGDDEASVAIGVCFAEGINLVKDERRAVGFLERAAAKGNVDAMVGLGYLWYTGRGVDDGRDDDMAYYYYKQAADRGDALGQVYFGELFEKGRGVAKDETLAVEWYRKAEQQGHPSGLVAMGRMYKRGGGGLPKDTRQALALFQKAADRNWPDAHYELGLMYEKGVGVDKSDAMAFKLYTTASNNRNDDALYRLGLMWIEGRGGGDFAGFFSSPNPFSGVPMVQKAAENGHAEAIVSMGAFHLTGLPPMIERNEAMAMIWFRKGAALGDPAAQNAVGYMYLEGKGVAQDDQLALKYFQLSADQGDSSGLCSLGELYEQGRIVEQDYLRAFQLYSASASKGEPEADNNLGTMYRDGLGVPPDDRMAAHHFQRAADQGLAKAQLNLSRMYRHGRGVPRDPQRAAELERLAKAQQQSN
ncbi:hypothetical protein BGW42_007788 [Actinomortierella wolfii]|nr:hypothetical protein BGW42_007788 [Actinomortierella wolfii]